MSSTPTSSGIPLTMQIQGAIGGMRPAIRQVAEHVLANPAETSRGTINALSESAKVSPATVVRFYQELGLESFAELKILLAAELGSRAEVEQRFEGSWDIRPDDTTEEAIEKIAESDLLSVQATVRSLDTSALVQIGHLLSQVSRVDIFGIGSSALVALDLKQKLTRIGLIAFAWTEAHEAASAASLLGPNSAAVAISHSGATQDIVFAMREARKRGARTIVLTGSPASPLAAEGEFVLTTAALETTFRSAAMSSRLAQLVVVDGLFAAVAHTTYERTILALQSSRDAVHHLKLPIEPGAQKG